MGMCTCMHPPMHCPWFSPGMRLLVVASRQQHGKKLIWCNSAQPMAQPMDQIQTQNDWIWPMAWGTISSSALCIPFSACAMLLTPFATLPALCLSLSLQQVMLTFSLSSSCKVGNNQMPLLPVAVWSFQSLFIIRYQKANNI